MKKINFNDNWIFQKCGTEDKRTINLPHDAMLEEKRGPECPSGSGSAYFAGGKYVYEKFFDVPEEWRTKCILLQFEGVYRKAEVYLNDRLITKCMYGYLPFWADLSDYLLFGKENRIRVVADNQDTPNSRWYTGAGIYRSVWIWTGNRVHIEPEGVRITTVSYEPAVISVEVEKAGDREQTETAVEILDNGKVIASAAGTGCKITIPQASLWNAEQPYLYQCRVTLKEKDVIKDEIVENFGIRKIEWSTKGLFINGKETLLKGGCIHHDNGLLGARSYRKAEERKVKKLKEWGFNATRSAHNPANPALLEACDKLGMYVLDETWDMWYKSKTEHDYAKDFMECYEDDMKAIVARDYNHPSVIMYSIGNELTEPADAEGVEFAKKLVEAMHKRDSTRPVTCGLNLTLVMMSAMHKQGQKDVTEEVSQEEKEINSTVFNETVANFGKTMCLAANRPEIEQLSTPCLDLMDIAGYNYATGRYQMEGELHPDRILVGSETMPQDISENWNMVEKLPYLIGDFMWTSWDYLGEAGVGAWSYDECCTGFNKPYPWLLAEAGVLDILGNDTAEAGLAAVVFEKRTTPYIGVRPVNHPGEMPAKAPWRGTNAIPAWSWRGCGGNKAEIDVFAEADEIELRLNEKVIGKKHVINHAAYFETIYEPGKLEAVAYKDGKEAGRSFLKSAEGTLQIKIEAEGKVTAGEIAFIHIDICGENGVVEANADAKLSVDVRGGRLLAFGSANPRTEESYLANTFTTYYGHSMAIVQVEDAGQLTVCVKSGNYECATKVFQIEKFFLGASTAAHQVEGNNVNSDSWIMEQLEHTAFKEPSADAVDQYNRYKEDIELMKDAGFNAYRFTIEWARIEPEKGKYDENEIAHYRDVIKCCRDNGIEPVITMHHFSSPKWLIYEGGWENEAVVEYFKSYCVYVVERLGDMMEYICTINEANMRLQMASIMKTAAKNMGINLQIGVNLDLPEEMLAGKREAGEAFGGVENVCTFLSACTDKGDMLVMQAHEAARDAMKAICPHLKIGITLSLHDIWPVDGGEEFEKANWTEEFTHYLPYMESDDFLGLQNYTRTIVNANGEIPVPAKSKKTQMGYEFYPQALENVIRTAAKDWKKAILVTENGIATLDDKERVAFIEEALGGVKRCLLDGIPVIGYLHWSLLDNFEWQLGYSRNFGLIEVDRTTMERKPRESFYKLAQIWGNEV